MNEQERVRARARILPARGRLYARLLADGAVRHPKAVYPDKAEDKNALKEVQGKFFKDVYNLISRARQGPRLYLYLFAVDPARYLDLLDFSGEEEKEEEPAAEEAGSRANCPRGRILQGARALRRGSGAARFCAARPARVQGALRKAHAQDEQIDEADPA